jgi:hypothetical protein
MSEGLDYPQREYRQNSSIKVVLLGADQGPHFNDFGASEALIVRAPCRPQQQKELRTKIPHDEYLRSGQRGRKS